MLITRATRHDRSDVLELLATHGWAEANVDEGTTFIARDGKVVGCVRLVQVEPQTLVVDDVLVREDRREQGIGRSLMRAAMNSRGGALFLCCHAERLEFYGHLGFSEISIEEAPEAVRAYWEKVDDYPTPPDHVHHFMRAR
ncbi:MAG: GNAT family N-acetyltransferase [Actinomycetota bacterium]|nr:GNAT family N-acetyltransferase [Actinomycetota bacterium]